MISRRGLLPYVVVILVVFAATGSSLPQARQAENRFESEIKKFEEADKQAPPPKGAVLFVGSSSIRFWKDLDKDFPATKVINRGFGGSQIGDSTYFADRIVIPYSPRMIVLYAGDNDLAGGKSPEKVFADYKDFVAKVRQHLANVSIAYISIKPSLARWQLTDQIKATNELIRGYVSHNKNLAFIDIFPAMLGTDGKPRPELYVKDGLHMTPEGYSAWRAIVAPYLK
jgi:lysophospholipase L1-like esterase